MSFEQLIVNELLAFIQNAIDTLDEFNILQICKSNFKEDEVCSGKVLLFRSVGKAYKMSSRQRDGTEESVQDIITLLKETDPDDVPTCVAKELAPVTFGHVDVTKLLKEINFLKVSLADVVSSIESVPESASPTAITSRDAPRPTAAAARPSTSPVPSRTCTSTPQRAYAVAAASLHADVYPKEKSSQLCDKRATPTVSQN
ncbi:unnamed protein product [Chilo suppressalis]|uniref:Uncharacterized protein n=1 Tax=Chilo suppressalis TaxID=168631 RepID=A0ABN8AQX4_CHISP|nr:unnamed protein product [Chilo suppressalis]